MANAEKVDRNTDKETSDAAECMTDSSRDLGVGGNGCHCDGSMGTKNDCESALRKDNGVKTTKKKDKKWLLGKVSHCSHYDNCWHNNVCEVMYWKQG